MYKVTFLDASGSLVTREIEKGDWQASSGFVWFKNDNDVTTLLLPSESLKCVELISGDA